MPDVEGALRAILIQHQLFISQFHQWRKFLDGVAASPFDASDLGLAKRAVSQVGRALEAHPDACDSRVPEALSAVGADLTNPGSLIKLAIFNAFSSVENALRGITNWLVKEARRFLGEAWDSLRSNLAKIAGAGMAALIIAVFAEPVVSEMAKKHPARFAYIRHITTLLKEEKDVVEHH